MIYGKNKFEGGNVVNYGTTIIHSQIGYGTYIGRYCEFSNVVIGKYCSIASRVCMVSSTHPTEKYVSTHPAFFSVGKQSGFTYVAENKFNENLRCSNGFSVSIGNDVWIGNDVLLVGGVTIGDGAIIGARSLVNEDVPPYCIAAGTPAKVIRKRFYDEEILKIQKIKWWDKPQEWIRDNAESFDDITKFLEKNR